MSRRKRKDNYVTVGSVKIRWRKFGDGRTAIDPRRFGRKRQTFVDHAEALREARRVAMEIYNGGADATAMTSDDRASWIAVRAAAKSHHTDPVAAISEWGEQRKAIDGSRHTMGEVIKAGLASLQRASHLVPDVVAEFLQTKAIAGLHGRYERGLKSTLHALALRFPGEIREITTPQLELYIDGETDPATKARIGGIRKRGGEFPSPRRRDNILDEIRQLFQFARLRGYLSDEVNAARKVASIHKLGGNITFFTPVEMRLILEHVTEEWQPYVILNCFAGGRAEELCLSKDAAKSKDPLRWEDIDFDEREIHVRPETSKIGKKRIMPLLDNAFEWLVKYRHCTGPIAPTGKRPDREFGKGARVERAINAALSDAPRLANEQPVQLQMEAIAPMPSPLLSTFTWRHNAFRHSYGSYRGSILKSNDQLADEMGNSPAMCARHYRNPRPIRQAKAWFAIFPPKAAENVVTFGHRAVA